MKIFVVIAAYNEEKSIFSVVQNLKNNKYKNIVVVDDGSYDSTYNVAKNTGVYVLKHLINRGQGAGLQTGIDFALEKGADVIVTFDADGQHKAEEIKRLLEPLKHGYDIALGSRFLGKTNAPWDKRLALKLGVLFTYFFSGIKLTDTHNGFRALSKKAAKTIRIKHDRMEHASEIIDQIKQKRLKYKEVPVTITYTKYSMSKGQGALNSIRIAVRLLFRRFMG